MRRGDVAVAVIAGDYGKPRPVVVMQDEVRYGGLASCIVVPLTSDLADAPVLRVAIEPDARNGLRTLSHAMIDKTTAIARTRIGVVVGEVSAERMREIGRALALILGLAPSLPPPPP